MKKRKILILALCALLLVALSVMGTLAYFSSQTNIVSNTFVAAKGLIDPQPEPIPTPDPDDPYNPDGFNGLFLVESEAEKDENDNYTLKADTYVIANSYTVAPGMTLPKDPYVRIHGKTETAAYLFVEVIDSLGTDSLVYEIDDSNWTLVDGVTGANGGKIYVYNTVVTADIDQVYILKDNQITIASDVALSELEKLVSGSQTLSFKAYLTQTSGFATPAEAIVGCGFATED